MSGASPSSERGQQHGTPDPSKPSQPSPKAAAQPSDTPQSALRNVSGAAREGVTSPPPHQRAPDTTDSSMAAPSTSSRSQSSALRAQSPMPTQSPSSSHPDAGVSGSAPPTQLTDGPRQSDTPPSASRSQQPSQHQLPGSSAPVPAQSTHLGTVGSAAMSARFALPTAAQRRRARELATVLLTLATCQACSHPLQDPITLPCGHSTCLQCIKDRVLPKVVPAEDEVPPLPCLTHLPPRLPLSPMTVPCPVNGCPRSAIGRGIGVWAGHQPRYGLIPTYSERLPVGAQDVGPGAPPVDGFVMGVADHPQRLTVIGPQTRSKAHLFAIPPHGVEPSSSTVSPSSESLLPSVATSNLLRTDVTLTKAVALLKRYASSPLPRPPRSRRSPQSSASIRSRSGRSHGLGRGRALARLRGTLPRGRGMSRSTESSSSSNITTFAGRGSAANRGRLAASQAGMGIFGMNESDLESGTVSGVRAVLSESDDSDEAGCSCGDDEHEEDEHEHHLVYSKQNNGWTLRSEGVEPQEAEEDEEEDDRLWPDLVGGAFSRPPLSGTATSRMRSKAKLKRPRARASGERLSPSSISKPALHSSDKKVAKKEFAGGLEEFASRQVDSGWSTEDSTAGSSTREGSRPGSRHVHDEGSSRLREDMLATKHSLALSSKVGPNGEPMIQTVATLHAELVENLECHLCYLLLYQPLTTPCGHTFCKPCFARSLDHGNRCPLCRSDMPNFSFFQDHVPNSALLKILTSDTATFSDEDADSDSAQETFAGFSIPMTKNPDGSFTRAGRGGGVIQDDPEIAPHHFGFKRMYEQRKSAIEQEEREARLSTPIFVCTLAFPGMPTILHIFEPRYRLMVRRCLESGNPRFGMVLPSRVNGGMEEYGTMLEIKSVQMLADGRSMLETVGSYRFKLLEKGSLDGYTVGRIERVDDISLEDEAELERAAMRRRAELDRKKAEASGVVAAADIDSTESNRPSTAPMSATSSQQGSLSAATELHSHSFERAEEEPLRHGSGSATPRGPLASGLSAASDSNDVSDPLSLYRGGEGAGSVATNDNAPSQGDAHLDHRSEQDTQNEEDSLQPFKPVPAEPSTEELVEICTSFIETLRSGSAPWLLSRLNHTYGPMPGAHEVERLGYWMALVMPIDEHEKAKLLPITSRRLRLCLVVHWIEQLRQSWWFNSGCTVS